MQCKHSPSASNHHILRGQQLLQREWKHKMEFKYVLIKEIDFWDLKRNDSVTEENQNSQTLNLLTISWAINSLIPTIYSKQQNKSKNSNQILQKTNNPKMGHPLILILILILIIIHYISSIFPTFPRTEEAKKKYIYIYHLWGTRVAATPFWRRISQVSAAETEGRLTWVVKRRVRWIKKAVPEPEPEPEIRAMAGALPEKMAALVRSDLPTPLQKHKESPKTPIIGKWGFDGWIWEWGKCWILLELWILKKKWKWELHHLSERENVKWRNVKWVTIFQCPMAITTHKRKVKKGEFVNWVCSLECLEHLFNVHWDFFFFFQFTIVIWS